MKHRHHIIPKHEGGSDDPSNIVYLSVKEHAEAHRDLYEKNGKIEDYLAWKGLSGIIGKEEIIEKLLKENGKKLGIRMMTEKKGIFRDGIHEEENYKDGISRGGKITGSMHSESGHCKKIAPLGGGKNLGKNYWYNESTGEETVAFESPGEGWVIGINMNRVNIEHLRKNSDNVKGSFWIKNEKSGETRMPKSESEIPFGFIRGRCCKIESKIDLYNTPITYKMEGIPQVQNIYRFIIFNPSNMRWELLPKKNSKRIVKISHNDYYGLVWIRDIIIEKYSIKSEKSIFNFTTELELEQCLLKLKSWREYNKIEKILNEKKLKKWRRDQYNKKLESLYEDYSFLELIREKIIPAL